MVIHVHVYTLYVLYIYTICLPLVFKKYNKFYISLKYFATGTRNLPCLSIVSTNIQQFIKSCRLYDMKVKSRCFVFAFHFIVQQTYCLRNMSKILNICFKIKDLFCFKQFSFIYCYIQKIHFLWRFYKCISMMNDDRCIQCRTHGFLVHITELPYIKHFDSDHDTAFCF